MKILKKGKLLLVLPPLLLLLFFASFRDGVSCPIGYCSDGIICVQCETATQGKAIGSLVNPPKSSTELTFQGNQAIQVKLTNHSILGAFLSVNCNYQNPPNADWSLFLFPKTSSTKDYSVFGTVPIGWKVTTSTISDAASVSIQATWDKW